MTSSRVELEKGSTKKILPPEELYLLTINPFPPVIMLEMSNVLWIKYRFSVMFIFIIFS